jgi:transcription initiation factor IIE alpha subunit
MTETKLSIREKILKLLTEFTGGLTSAEMEPLLQVDPKTLRPLLSKLVTSRLVKISGKRTLPDRRPMKVYQLLTKENQWT